MKAKKALMLSVALISLAYSALAQSWITNGLVAYYPFNGNANDVTGNGYHGKIYGNVVAANDRFGNTASAYHFDGSLGNIWVTNTVFNIGQTAYTISGWFCSDDVTKLDQTVFNTVPHAGIALVVNSSYAPSYLDYSMGNCSSWDVLNAHGPKHDYTNQIWYHIAFTKTGTNYIVYVNGKVDATPTLPQSATYNYNVSYLFGACNDTGLGVFKGRLDDFRVYNRALSSNEVVQLYAAESVPGYLINATSGEHGTILPMGVVPLLPGSGTNFVMTADPGYHIADVLVDGVSVGPTNSWTFNDVTNGRTISVTFAINTYSIHSSAGANGTILPSGVVSVEEGDTTNFVVTANSGRHIASVQVDGVPVGEFGMGSNLFQYIFHNVTTNHTISAAFNTPPVVGVTASSTSGVVPLKVLFDFASSSDDENNINRCEVDKDGDGSIDSLSETGRIVTVEYTEPGEYHAKLRVVDACGAFSETNLLIKPHFNTPPVANSQTVTTTLNNATIIVLSGSDADDDPLSFTVTAQPIHGTLKGVGAIRTYSPDTNFIGNDSFRFVSSDGRTNSSEAVVTINVTTALQKMRIKFSGYMKTDALTNFPLLVVLNPGLLTNGFSYSHFASPNGYDLRFTDESETTNLNYEVETWNTNGASYVWVQVPVLKNGGSIWAWWGDQTKASSIPVFTTNGATWHASYKAVWHLAEPAGNALDATGKGGTAVAGLGAARTVGRISGGAGFNGLNNSEFVSSSCFGLTNSSVTLETWAYVDVGEHGTFLKIGNDSTGYSFGLGGNYLEDAGQNFRILLDGVRWIRPTASVGVGWHHFALVISSNGVPEGFVDGASVGTFSGTMAKAPAGEVTRIGGNYNATYSAQRHFNGMLDEVRISATPRSSNWIWACWSNVSSNNAFSRYGDIVMGGKDAYNVPDDWKIHYFGGTGIPGAESLDDYDHDGIANLYEYLAGTDPTNAYSKLEITSLPTQINGTNFMLRWSSVSGKYYSVDVSTNLMEGFSINVASNIPGTPAMNILTIRVDRAVQKFFRIHVEP